MNSDIRNSHSKHQTDLHQSERERKQIELSLIEAQDEVARLKEVCNDGDMMVIMITNM